MTSVFIASGSLGRKMYIEHKSCMFDLFVSSLEVKRLQININNSNNKNRVIAYKWE